MGVLSNNYNLLLKKFNKEILENHIIILLLLLIISI